MTPKDVNDWLDRMIMKWRGKAKTEGDCARLLGVSLDTMPRMKQRGSDRKTALACAALMAGLDPHKAETKGMNE